jgi:hypothetical protein
VLVVLAAVGLYAVRRRSDALALASVAVLVPVGYLFFWGIANISFLSKAGDRFGPYYFLPVLVPLAAFGVEGAARTWAWRRGVFVAAAVAALALTGVGTASAVSTALGERDARAQPYDALDRITDRDRPALVFLPGQYLGVSVLDRYSESTSANGDDRYVVSAGNADIDLVRHYPGYDAHRLLGCDFAGETPLGSETFPAGEPSLALVTGKGAQTRRLHLAVTQAPDLTLTVSVDAAADAQLEVVAGTAGVVVPVRAPSAGAATITVLVSAAGVSATGDVGPATPTTLTSDQPLTVRLTTRATPTAPLLSATWLAPIELRPNAVTVLLPARTFTSPDHPFVSELETCRASTALHVAVDASVE